MCCSILEAVLVLCCPAALADQVRQQLDPGGLPQQQWPTLDVLPISSWLQQHCRAQHQDKLQLYNAGGDGATSSSSDGSAKAGVSCHEGSGTGPSSSGTSNGINEDTAQQAAWVYCPPNPNSANTNHAVVHLCQVTGGMRG